MVLSVTPGEPWATLLGQTGVPVVVAEVVEVDVALLWTVEVVDDPDWLLLHAVAASATPINVAVAIVRRAGRPIRPPPLPFAFGFDHVRGGKVIHSPLSMPLISSAQNCRASTHHDPGRAWSLAVRSSYKKLNFESPDIEKTPLVASPPLLAVLS